MFKKINLSVSALVISLLVLLWSISFDIASYKIFLKIDERLSIHEVALGFNNMSINILKQYINILDIKRVTEAGVSVHNTTARGYTSGTHIKIKDISYIITCAHLLEKESDVIFCETDDNSRYPLSIVKINKEKDLALFKVENIENISYLDIAKNPVVLGDKVYIISNYKLFGKDIVTDGVVSGLFENKYYLITNISKAGSSGSPVIYNNEIVGILTGTLSESEFKALQKNIKKQSGEKDNDDEFDIILRHIQLSVIIRLDVIREFLKDI